MFGGHYPFDRFFYGFSFLFLFYFEIGMGQTAILTDYCYDHTIEMLAFYLAFHFNVSEFDIWRMKCNAEKFTAAC